MSDQDRQWSADGLVLIAPDMMAHLPPILERAMAEYGPAYWENGWTVGGVVFSGNNPSTRILPGQPVVIIVLSMDAADDPDIASAFLAHELVHCLHLYGGGHQPPMIEEGAAVRLSLMEASIYNPDFAARLREHQTMFPGTEHYAEALLAVERLLEIEPAAIRRLREQDPSWDAITAERILAVAPACPPELAAVLAEVREMRPDNDYAEAMATLAERKGKA